MKRYFKVTSALAVFSVFGLAAVLLSLGVQPRADAAKNNIQSSSSMTMPEPSVRSSSTTAAAIPACSDTAYVHKPWKVASPIKWQYNPTGEYATNARASIEAGFRVWPNSHNDCGYSYTFNIPVSYTANTTRQPQVNTDGTCGQHDGFSTVGWKNLSTTSLAVTCTWYTNGQVVGIDMVFNTDYVGRLFTGPVPAGCTNKYYIPGIAAHEWGHGIGLGHPVGAEHAELTMDGTIPVCNLSVYTLGRGDIIGTNRKY